MLECGHLESSGGQYCSISSSIVVSSGQQCTHTWTHLGRRKTLTLSGLRHCHKQFDPRLSQNSQLRLFTVNIFKSSSQNQFMCKLKVRQNCPSGDSTFDWAHWATTSPHCLQMHPKIIKKIITVRQLHLRLTAVQMCRAPPLHPRAAT